MENGFIRKQLLEKTGELEEEEEIICKLNQIQEPVITEGTVMLTILCC